MNDSKSKIREIEAEILSITSAGPGAYRNWTEDIKSRNRAEFLLKRRRNLLNDMFQFTEENLARLREINSRLTHLTEQAYQRLHDFDVFTEDYRFDFSDGEEDYESRVRFFYLGDKSELKLGDDDWYGSNFTLIIKALAELYIAKGQEDTISVSERRDNPDNGKTWLDEPLWKWRDKLNDIIISYAVHDLICNKAHSLPDLLRLNSFSWDSYMKFHTVSNLHDDASEE